MRFILLGIICTSITLINGCGYAPDSTRIRVQDGGGQVSGNNHDRSTGEVSLSGNDLGIKNPILQNLQLPQGFSIEILGSADGARSLARAEDNTKYVLFIGTKDVGKVYAMVDRGKDYKIDETIVLASNMNMPNGVAYKDGALYIAEVDRILVIDDILNNLLNPQPKVVVADLPNDAAHGRKYIAFGPDGMLYVPIGAPCNICNSPSPFASLRKYDTQTWKRTIVAEGIRNTVGFTRHPQTQELRFTDNGRDWLGDNSPPDELNRITQAGQHFGYPFCHGGYITDPVFNTKHCDQFTPPFINLGAHVAALGVKFYTGNMFPKEYNHKILIAEHGSRNRSVATGYRITMVDIDKKTYTGFISGWFDGKTLGRPVDILHLPDGSILISDDYSDYIYRVKYTSNKQ